MLLQVAGNIQAQDTRVITGTVWTEDHQILSYVNIGIVGTSVGTVSKEDGSFSLYLKESNGPEDTLRVSMIGYKSQSFRLENILSAMKVTLQKDYFDLVEVVVKPKFKNRKIAGRQKTNSGMNVNFSIAGKPRQNLGAEIGKRFKVKKETCKVESLRFFIRANNFEEVKFRVLFYNIKKGKPSSFLTDEDIIVRVSNKQTGWIEIDLSQYDILTNKNFIASLQWIDASEKGRSLALPIKLPVFGSHHYYKFGSQARWKHFRNMSATMNVTLAY